MTKRQNLNTQRNLLESAIKKIGDSISLAREYSTRPDSLTLSLAQTHLRTRLTGIGVEIDSLADEL